MYGLTRSLRNSGLTRSLRTSAFSRPTAARPVFQQAKNNALPSIAARWQSTDAVKKGKIHQVIGAVVDGT